MLHAKSVDNSFKNPLNAWTTLLPAKRVDKWCEVPSRRRAGLPFDLSDIKGKWLGK